MVENLKKFMARLVGSEKLQKEFKAIAGKGSTEEIYQFALKNSEGGFTKEEFKEYITELMSEVEYAKKNILNDQTLENVAGGIVLPGKEFWERVSSGEMGSLSGKKEVINADAPPELAKETGKGAMDYIYGKELELQQKKNKGETIQAAMGAANNLVSLISTLGGLGLGIQDIKKQEQLRKDKALENKVKHLENMLVIDELEKQCKELGINLS